MSDAAEIYRSRTPDDGEPFRIGSTEPIDDPGDDETAADELDSHENKEIHARLISYRDYEAELQHPNRVQMAIDEGYRDHQQYTTEELRELEARRQAPAIANEVKPIIDYMIGVERRMRTEGKALPREKNDRRVTIAKTSLLKYLSDQNKTPMERSLAFKEMVSAGLSWLYCGVRADNEDGEPVIVTHESWRAVTYDSFHKRMDYKDARYWFRDRFVDMDVGEKFFPNRKHMLAPPDFLTNNPESERNSSPQWYLGERLSDRHSSDSRYVYGRSMGIMADSTRSRTRLTEAWWKEPMEVDIVRTPGQFFGVRIHEDDGPLKWLIKKSGLKFEKSVIMVPFTAIMTDHGLLAKQKTPFRHNNFPGVPLWCYRASNDGTPYGVIRGIRDQQDLINKRRSKAVFLLSSNQIITDSGLDPEILDDMRDQVARPDGVVAVPAGVKRFEIRRDVALAHQLEQAAMNDKAYMRETSGASTEALGQTSNATSGKAVVARQNQATIVSAEIFDNYGYALQMEGEITLSNAEQFIPDARVVRVLNDRGIEQFTAINMPDEKNPDALVNPIAESRADFHIAMEDFRESARKAAYEELMNLMSQLAPTAPDLVMAVLDIIIDASDVPGAERIAKRVRAVTGQRDEDAVPTPEETKELEQQQQAKMEQQTLDKRAAEADVLLKEKQVEEAQAKIEKVRAEIGTLSSEQLDLALKAILGAIAASKEVLANPSVGKVAAEILDGADAPSGQDAPVLPAQQPAAPAPVTAPTIDPNLPLPQPTDGALQPNPQEISQ